MNDFLANLFRKWCASRTKANRELVERSSVKPAVVRQVELPVVREEEPISENLILQAVRERSRGGYIVLGKDRLFRHVALRMKRQYGFGTTSGISHLPEWTDRHVYPMDGGHYVDPMAGAPIPPEYYPKKLDDIETPGDWINDLPLCQQLTYMMHTLKGDISHAADVLVPSDQLRFMLRESKPIVSIKLYTDTSWIEAGWGGPCISLSKVGDAMTYTTHGTIPDDLRILTPAEMMVPFTHFYNNKLQRMFESHHSVIEYKEAYNDLVSTLNHLNITFQ